MTHFSNLSSISNSVGLMLKACSDAINNGLLIQRQSKKDKEFHFQNWFQARLESQSIDFDEPGRNTYPDFRLVHEPLGFEIKGLAFPGRVNDYDCNSQIPHGIYRGRHIIYVFGRYPDKPSSDQYSVHDLVFCHGSFLNTDNGYVHKNKSVRGLGSYGDILLRDRKMYVAKTPFSLLKDVARQITLLLPENWPAPKAMTPLGRVIRIETDKIMTGYTFDLITSELKATYSDNPSAGYRHSFVAYRPNNLRGPSVSLR